MSPPLRPYSNIVYYVLYYSSKGILKFQDGRSRDHFKRRNTEISIISGVPLPSFTSSLTSTPIISVPDYLVLDNSW